MSHDENRGEDEHLAPVIPLFGGSRSPQAPAGDVPRSAEDLRRELLRRGIEAPEIREQAERPERRPAVDDEPSEQERIEAAAAALVKRLRGRSLSEREVRTFLLQQELSAAGVESVLDDMLRLGYVDDAALAEQLVHAATTRKGEGRAAIAQTLSRRGVPRDVADAALSAVGDDDAERALEFARKKASSVGGRDHEASLRRLVGQLSRRGYPSSVAMTAARQALAEREQPVRRGPWFD